MRLELPYCISPQKFWPKKSPAKYRAGNSRENVSVLGCMNAAGQAIPPLCIMKGKTPSVLSLYDILRLRVFGHVGAFRCFDWKRHHFGRRVLDHPSGFGSVAKNPWTREYALCCVRGSIKNGLTLHLGPQAFTIHDVLS